ncbi:MAG: RNA-guided endonuclease InsQ/TnpB family protein [Candidatus Thorarchaeota archaeon]|jgi:IS605 OrfB family transposase
MGRSKGTIISVKVPIRWGVMTDRQRTRLNRITGRDTRVIKAYLGVIERHENELLTGRKRTRINASLLDELTLTASRGKAHRSYVPHDFKLRFPNISVNEFQECRDTATAMWQSYLELGGRKPLGAKGYSTRKIPRYAFLQRFEIVYTPSLEIRHWLKLRDSLDSARTGRKNHDKLMIPLSTSSYHLKKMKEGKVKTVRIFKDNRRKWWAIFTVTLDIEVKESSAKPPAVLSIDLGINKAACSVLLTQKGFKQVKFWKQEDKHRRMQVLDDRIASLQTEKETLLSHGRIADSVSRKLRSLSRKRQRVSRELDRKLVKAISDHIQEIAKQYDLYVSIGKVKGIRNTARRGNFKGSKFRGMIHRWAFARIRDMLGHKLATLGFDAKRYKAVPEQWTSIMCHKCGHKGLRPKQNLFICHTCGYRANADLNGAINIGKRLIMLIPSLRDEKGLGMWLTPKDKAILKARRKTRSSKGKSSLPQKSPASIEGESVADCYDQASLEEVASSEDPAMAIAVETPSASMNTGGSGGVQRTEAKSELRDYVPMKSDKDHVTKSDLGLIQTGDSSREKGGTQKFLESSLKTSAKK